MAELLVRDIPDALVSRLQSRAAEHGISTEEELRQILERELPPEESAEECPGYNLRDHLFKLAEVAPDIDFTRKRTRSMRPPLDF